MGQKSVEDELLLGFYKYLDYLDRNYNKPNLDGRVSSSFSRLCYLNASPNCGFLFNNSVNLQLNNDYFEFMGYINGLFDENFQNLVTPINSDFSKLIEQIRKDSTLCSKISKLMPSSSPVLVGTQQLIDINSININSSSFSSPFLILPVSDLQIDYSDAYSSLDKVLNNLSSSFDCSLRKIE